MTRNSKNADSPSGHERRKRALLPVALLLALLLTGAVQARPLELEKAGGSAVQDGRAQDGRALADAPIQTSLSQAAQTDAPPADVTRQPVAREVDATTGVGCRKGDQARLY